MQGYVCWPDKKIYVGLQREIRMFFFFACPKKKNEKERAPVSLVPPKAGCPVLLDAAGALQTRLSPQTVQIPFSAASPVLGCVPMGFPLSPFVLPHLADGGGKDAKTV